MITSLIKFRHWVLIILALYNEGNTENKMSNYKLQYEEIHHAVQNSKQQLLQMEIQVCHYQLKSIKRENFVGGYTTH